MTTQTYRRLIPLALVALLLVCVCAALFQFTEIDARPSLASVL